MANQVWFSSDPHYFHKGALHFRPQFKSVEEMNVALVNAWNSKVGFTDTAYILGDLSFGGPEQTAEVLAALNGRLHWVVGNHDDRLQENKTIRSFFETINGIKYISVEGQKIMMCHFPMLTWRSSHHGSWMLHGHSHGNCQYPYDGKIMDVGVDTNGDLAPYSFEEIQKFMSTKGFTAVDHHQEK